MIKKLSYLFFLFAFVTLHAQKEASFWYFGQNAGLQFDADSGTVTAITNGKLNTLEGCTSISDTDGKLLFYSDGITIWNRNHSIMQNGTGLKGDPSSTSSGLIVPKPQDPDFYYIFTVDEPHHNNSIGFPNQIDGDGINDGLTYSRININDAGGLGAVDALEKNIPLVTYDQSKPLHVDYKCSEKITAVRADDCFSFWVITHFADSFYAFKVDTNGVSTTPVISTVGPNVPPEGYRRNALGYLKASPDGTKLAVAHFGFSNIEAQDAPGGVYLFDFDNDTGIITNSLELYGPQNGDSPYGIEFSAENKKVYATIGNGSGGGGTSQVIQWDLESTNIPASSRIINSSNNFSAGALQLGIDKRIYRAQVNFQNINTSGRFLGVINNPEANGTLADYDSQGILIDVNGFNQNLSRIGLPPFIQSLFNSQIDIIQNGESTTEVKLCTNETYTLTAEDIPGADYLWTKDGVPLPETAFELEVNEPGFYEVFIEPNNGECPIEGSAIVGVFEIPVANPLTNITSCDDNNDNVFLYDFTIKNTEVLGLQDASMFSVSYFTTIDDANSNDNEITFPFQNTENPQEIFVRVNNNENANCFDVNSFTLTVFNTPIVSRLENVILCDTEGDITDGIITTNLLSLNTDVLGPSQNLADYTITYHRSLNDANNVINPLPNNYINSPFTDQVFVRIVNNNNTDCVTVDSFTITINLIPEANDASIFQCDEDGVPDGLTTYNVNQLNDDVSGSNPNSNVTYYLNFADATSQTNAINAESFNNTTNPQFLVARVTNTTTQCFSFSDIILTASATSANDAVLGICDTDGIEDGFVEFDLSLADTDVLFGLPSGLDLKYYQTLDEALTEINPLPNNYINTTAYNQTIFVRVENDNNCYGINEVELQVLGLPNIETEFETLYCLNTFPEKIVLTGGVIDDIPNNYYYDWSTGETTKEIEVNEPGIYTVLVRSVLGCTKERTITVLASNTATITNIEVTDASQNNSITILVSGEGDYEYALNYSNGQYQNSNVFENVTPGIYSVYVRDKNNCGITEDSVSVIGFPKFFTPNGDNQNDFWNVKGVSSQFQPNTKIIIFDKYGKIIAQVDPIGSGWDGNYNGNPMPTSDYWFSVTLDDGRQFSSHFTLKR